MMKSRFLAQWLPHVALTIGLTASFAAQSVETPPVITWPDLEPALVKKLEDQAYEAPQKIKSMPDEQREAYEKVREELSLRKRIELGFIDEELLDEKTKASLANPPSQRHPKALAFWKDIDSLYGKIKKQRGVTNPELNDKKFRMAGYLLPLEFTEDKITDFLLVPYIGACMHAPTPASNQMIFVTASQPFASDRLYQPIWVEGVLRSEKGTHKLSLVDGTTDVKASYTMKASLIEPYQR